MQDEPQREWLTVDEVAAIFRVNIETVRRWIRGGELPALSLGGPRSGYRIRRADLDTFINSRYGAAQKSNRVALNAAAKTRGDQAAIS